MKRVKTRKSTYLITVAILCAMLAGCGGGFMSGQNVPYVAPAGNIDGYVYSKTYNEDALARIAARTVPTGYSPVQGALVSIATTTLTDTTDADGRFYFQDLPVGSYAVQVTKNGETLSFTVTVTNGATTVANDAVGDENMVLAPSQTGTLTVTAYANCAVLIPAETTVRIKTANQADFQNTSAKTPVAIISDIAAGAYSVDVSSTDYAAPASQDVTITAGGAETLSFTLTPASGNTTPVAQISSPPDGATFVEGDTVIFTGVGLDCEDGNIPSANLSWSSDISGSLGTGSTLSSSELAEGEHTITLTVADAGGNTDTETIKVTIGADRNTAPTAVIYSPANGSAYDRGVTITFLGVGVDEQDGNLDGSKLVWTSSIDGALGSSTSMQSDDELLNLLVSNLYGLETNSLSSGDHTITLTATDSRGKTGTASINITVSTNTSQNAPSVTIVTPANNSSYGSGATILFTGAATDAEDGTLSGASLSWSSSIDGSLGTGTTITKSGLQTGTHTIILTAVDSDTMAGQANITIVIQQNNSPTATIASPAGGSSYSSGAIVPFSGSGTDQEDVILTGSSLVWTSSLDGQIGTGGAFQKSDLTVGSHTITLTVTDSGGLTSQDTAAITVTSAVNNAPLAAIVLPFASSFAGNYTYGNSITFAGGATDSEDVTLTGDSLVWTSSLDGQIGTGTNFAVSNLSRGSHTITLTATDSQAAVDTATVAITVN